jgi:hypothetical protein
MHDWWILNDPETSPGGGSGEDGGSTEGAPGEQTEAPGGQASESTDETVPRSELARANAEAAKFRKQLREEQAKVAGFEANQKTEFENARDKAKAAEDRADKAEERNRELHARLVAAEVGVVREAHADAARLLDWSSIEDPDDEEQVKAAMQTLVKEKPYLLGTSSGADGGAGRSGGQQESADMNSMLRSASGR